ncbi:MAG: N-6 DNA methylase, partial [Candidatus Pacebacteria bacterium]|nr:N-6 DNA methylase [Candidatus Paceibacterota bacterium]
MNLDATLYGILTNYKDFWLFDYGKGREKSYKFYFLDIKNNPEKLKEFILIFSKESLIDEKRTEKLKQESEVEEKKLTARFYKLFHETRLMMLKEFQENGLSKNNSLHYAQLFLNRLMFVFFAEDKNLIPLRILEEKIIKELDSCSDNSTRVCDEIRVLFEDLDKGSTNKNLQQFNGGLFKESISRDAYFKDLRGKSFFKGTYSEKKKLEENLKLKEEERKVFNKLKKYNLSPIIENILLMASYDFKSDLKVNILGHIFEQSLSDLEEINTENVSKRKKDGIFYTPEYITDYICRNTIVPYLSKSGTNDVDVLIEEYSNELDILEEKFKKIKILDPACGSGIFLVEAYRRIVEKEKDSDKISDKKLIELLGNNIYGIDKNITALNVAIFSLYIALLDYKEPKDIRNIELPNLLNENLFEADFFDTEHKFNEVLSNIELKFIIGNPPWGNKKYDLHLKYIGKGKNKLPIANFEISQTFLLRVKDFNHIKCALIITSKAFHNIGAKKFKQYFIKNFFIDEFFDLSPSKLSIFKNAKNPATIVFYNYANEINTEENVIKYLSLKPNIFLKYFNSLVIEKYDIKNIKQGLFGEYEWLWKIALYGSVLDFNFIRRIKKKLTIGKLIDELNEDEKVIFVGDGIKWWTDDAINKLSTKRKNNLKLFLEIKNI